MPRSGFTEFKLSLYARMFLCSPAQLGQDKIALAPLLRVIFPKSLAQAIHQRKRDCVLSLGLEIDYLSA
jgi:hypothetical protein